MLDFLEMYWVEILVVIIAFIVVILLLIFKDK